MGQSAIIAPPGPEQSILYNVKGLAYGAKGDGSTDDTTAIQSALTACGVTGGVIYFPPGTYKISGILTIPSGVIVRGTGPGSTVVTTTSATLDVFKAAASAQNVGVESLLINSSVTRTAGIYVNFPAGTALCWLRDFTLGAPFIGVALNTDSGGYVIHGKISAPTPDGTAAGSAGIIVTNASGNDNYIDKVTLVCANGAECTYGIYVSNCGCLNITDCDIIRALDGLYIDTGAVYSINCVNSYFDHGGDSGGSHGLFANVGAGGIFARSNFTNCWFCSSGLTGVKLKTTSTGSISGITFTGCDISLGLGDGVQTVGASQTAIQNICLTNCKIDGNSAGSGLSLSGCQNVRVVGCDITGNLYTYFVVGTTDYLTVGDSYLSNTNAGTGSVTHTAIANNFGS